ncbi:hypothetical protein M438DRAFT_402779 [Aureobasidium pullulans EXF-150]|uniref:Uncharacterized protein n=1 Tax=Aureobasidium pullulans EXF-150 TaxID=1043002 RepID=A0A074XTW3_AURPU|nr:uncharacterized protein M438DRAFT_402779 [Aureobasidium pullulans EXF-150]KEQ89028.1 hypothetical protein M438DRAFT_402779 [Aureobasidium pullulans EXF-150]
MAAGFNVIAAIREKAFGHVVENETKAAFSVSAVSHMDDGFNVIDAVIWFVVASFNAVVIIVDVAVDFGVEVVVEVVVIGSRNAYLMSGDYLEQGYWPATLLNLVVVGEEQKTKQAKRFKHHETRGSRTFVDDKHLCQTWCLHWASLHGPLKPIERHDGSEFTSIVQEEQVIGLLPLVVAFFTKYSVHSDDQSDRHLRS